MGDFSFQLIIGKIKVGSIENASSLNIGRNNQRDFKCMSKSNSGIGKILGNRNRFPHSKNWVNDPDKIDMCWDTGRDLNGPAQNKKNPFLDRLGKI